MSQITQAIAASSGTKSIEKDKTAEEWNSGFYSNGSIYVGNKYLVGFYGEYVQKAVDSLIKYAARDMVTNIPKEYNGRPIYKEMLNRWIAGHVNKDNKGRGFSVEMKWVVDHVDVPTVKTITETGYTVDTEKSIQFPLVRSHAGPGLLNLTVIENKDLIWYQFFNALINCFFSPQLLKPTSSFQKLCAYVATFQGHNMGSGTYDMVPTQVFEFNSIVLKDPGSPRFVSSDAKKMMYNVSFECPDLFQQPFKEFGTFRGISDNMSDKEMLSGSGSVKALKINRFEDSPASAKARSKNS
jgi:hypothetical protein